MLYHDPASSRFPEKPSEAAPRALAGALTPAQIGPFMIEPALRDGVLEGLSILRNGRAGFQLTNPSGACARELERWVRHLDPATPHLFDSMRVVFTIAERLKGSGDSGWRWIAPEPVRIGEDERLTQEVRYFPVAPDKFCRGYLLVDHVSASPDSKLELAMSVNARSRGAAVLRFTSGKLALAWMYVEEDLLPAQRVIERFHGLARGFKGDRLLVELAGELREPGSGWHELRSIGTGAPIEYVDRLTDMGGSVPTGGLAPAFSELMAEVYSGPPRCFEPEVDRSGQRFLVGRLHPQDGAPLAFRVTPPRMSWRPALIAARIRFGFELNEARDLLNATSAGERLAGLIRLSALPGVTLEALPGRRGLVPNTLSSSNS